MILYPTITHLLQTHLHSSLPVYLLSRDLVLKRSGKKQPFEPLEVVPEHLNLMLNGALNKPRNLKYDYIKGTELKARAGAYIWRKMGMLGYVTGVHSFKPKQFLYTVRDFCFFLIRLIRMLMAVKVLIIRNHK